MSKHQEVLEQLAERDPVSSLVIPEGNGFVHTGITVKSWYAGQALAGLLANPAHSDVLLEELADRAWLAADYLTQVRSQEEE